MTANHFNKIVGLKIPFKYNDHTYVFSHQSRSDYTCKDVKTGKSLPFGLDGADEMYILQTQMKLDIYDMLANILNAQ